MTRAKGFTLIELLVVIAILAILMSLLLPMIGIARRHSAVTSTRSLIKRVTSALEAFRSDVGAYPWQAHDPAQPYPQANRLAYHLAHDPTPSELTDLRADAALASGRYDPSSANGTMVLQRTHIDPAEANAEDATQSGIASTVNRMAATRARVAVYAGAAHITGFKAWGGYDHSASRLVPQSRSMGFARDYLADEISDKEVRGDAIIDRWGQPLIYVCPVLPGVRSSFAPDAMGRAYEDHKQWVPEAAKTIDGAAYGLGRTGRSITTSMDSDIRTTAARPYAMKPEIWSAGPDRRCDPIRDAPVNADNIAVEPYDRELR